MLELLLLSMYTVIVFKMANKVFGNFLDGLLVMQRFYAKILWVACTVYIYMVNGWCGKHSMCIRDFLDFLDIYICAGHVIFLGSRTG